jgi:hypothetical protein
LRLSHGGIWVVLRRLHERSEDLDTRRTCKLRYLRAIFESGADLSRQFGTTAPIAWNGAMLVNAHRRTCNDPRVGRELDALETSRDVPTGVITGTTRPGKFMSVYWAKVHPLMLAAISSASRSITSRVSWQLVGRRCRVAASNMIRSMRKLPWRKSRIS